MAANADQTLAHNVPAQVGLYAEVRGGGDLLTRLTDPQIWSTLAELAGQPARPEDVTVWRTRIEKTVKMKPEEAIRVLFSKAVAFVGEGPGRAQDAVVLCQPNHGVTTTDLLKRWNAQRQPQPVNPPTYQLFSNIGVSEHNGLLLFGDTIPKDGLFTKLQRFTAQTGAVSLADDPLYHELLSRVPSNPEGVLFARLGQAAPLLIPSMSPTSQPDTQPSTTHVLPDLPGPLRNSENIMLALHREGELLHFTAVGDAQPNRAKPQRKPVRLIESLPEQTLLAWQGRFDFSKMGESFASLPDQNLLQGIFQLKDQIQTFDRFLNALDSNVCLAIGPVSPPERNVGAPPLPAVAFMVGTRDTSTAMTELRNVINVGVGGYVLFAFQRGLPPLQPVAAVSLGNTTAYVLDLSPLLKQTARQALGQIQLCWVVHENVLILSTHLEWLNHIVESREKRTNNAAKFMRIPRGGGSAPYVDAFLIQSGTISDIASAWLDYIRKNKPEVLQENWWRNRQPGGGQARLGINVTAEPANRRLIVNEIFADQPATGRLRIGDHVIGYNNVRFTSDNPIAEMTKAIRERPHARWLALLIERDGRTLQIRIPIPFIDPTQALHRVIAVGKVAQRAVYRDDQSDPAGPRGFLTIEMRVGPQPVPQAPTHSTATQ